MKDQVFIARLKDIASIRTVYMWGMFGGQVTESRIIEKAKQYPAYYNAAKQSQLRALRGKDVYAFDCVGLIKGILWGWKGDPIHPHGGAIYQSKGLPDIDANVMINRCEGVSSDFSKIVPGAAVWLQGHIGVYIGEGKVIEATPAWKDGVQVTALANLGSVAGLPSRRWTKWGRLPWVEYEPAPELLPMPKTIVPAFLYDELRGERKTHQTYIIDGVTYAPVRVLAESLGVQTHYNSNTKHTTLRK